MSTEQINALADAAMLRLHYFINRKACQQVRRMREVWAAADAAARKSQSISFGDLQDRLAAKNPVF